MSTKSRFDQSAATWDAKPQRIALARAVGEAVLRQTQPTPEMDVLDYGCGTGLLGLFLLAQVRSVTGADSSSGMLDVLEEKIRANGAQGMKTLRLDLQRDPLLQTRYHLIVANMVMHHIERPDVVLAAFHEMLLPGGAVAVADLDQESGDFHGPGNDHGACHHGFDRGEFKDRLCRAGFVDMEETTVHVIRKPIAGGGMGEFPVFLVVGRRAAPGGD